MVCNSASPDYGFNLLQILIFIIDPSCLHRIIYSLPVGVLTIYHLRRIIFLLPNSIQ